MILDPDTIYTDENGSPFDRPEAPGPDATSEEIVAYLRADAAYRDAITNCANRNFSERFRKAVRSE